MKALILAAGFGSRLSPITDTIPKSLVPVNGVPILLKQIENLVTNGITDITVISGYKAQILKDAVHSQYEFVRIIENTEYAVTNNMYSAYLGLKSIGCEDVFMMNADVFFDASVIETLIQDPSLNAIVTDIGSYNEESMKVVEQNGRLVQIAKTITQEEALGCSIDVYKFHRDGAAAFFHKCQEYIEEKQDRNKWSEVALNDILSQIEFHACPLNGRWVEIDNHEDLAMAEMLFQS